MSCTLCTFNVNNLFVRYKFGETFPGDRSGKSKDPRERAFGFLPFNYRSSFEDFKPEERQLAADAAGRGNGEFPDILCLQEVESMIALRNFNSERFKGHYRHALVLDAHDPRQIDVGLLTNLEIVSVRSHMDEITPDSDRRDDWLFSRDCLEVTLELNGGGATRLTLFINHLKSKLDKDPAKAAQRREMQATRVAEIVHERFPGSSFQSELFAVVGDFNDEPESAAVASLVKTSGLCNALERIAKPEERWTYWYSGGGTVSQIDHMLLSPALDRATAGSVPYIEHRGIGFSRVLKDGSPGPRTVKFKEADKDPNPVVIDFQFERFKKVEPKFAASDHCPVFLEIA